MLRDRFGDMLQVSCDMHTCSNRTIAVFLVQRTSIAVSIALYCLRYLVLHFPSTVFWFSSPDDPSVLFRKLQIYSDEHYYL